MRLMLDPNVEDPDAIYEQLIALHRGLSEKESLRLNACIILLLANQIGERDVVLGAFAEANRLTGQA